MNIQCRRLIGLLALVLTAASVAPAARRNIVLTLDKKEIRDMTSSGLVLVFQIEVANASSNAYSLSEYDYRVVVEGTDLFAWRTSLEEPIPVDKSSKARIALPIKISYAEVYKTIPAAEGKTKLNGYATGLMIFTDAKKRQEKVPFAFSGEFPVFKDVEIKVRPVALKVLTIGGTEFDFSFSLENPNDFELVLGDLTYSLDFDGRTAAKGTITGENRLDAAGDKAFSLPVMLDFFEVGKEFTAIFDKSAAAVRLSLTATADSIWGPVKLSYTQAGQAQLKAAD
jgi:LEA14-like dessication related protein